MFDGSVNLFDAFDDKPNPKKRKNDDNEEVRKRRKIEERKEILEIMKPAEKEEPVIVEKEGLLIKHDVLHDVALPKNWNGTREDALFLKELPPPEEMAKTYPFKLDTFQERAVRSIESNKSVLVSAHTSAGKTAVAEYAIALSLREGQRVIYTSPIKALSNQKFRELAEEFQDVGLMTGDVTLKPNASCIVMTTEILRSMLYRGSEMLNEVAWVIFDEVHYMRDAERGVVWEETMVLLPNNVRHVFLSATIPNSLEFASWIADLKSIPVHVVYTDFRPTPLQHYIFPSGAGGMYLVVDEKGKFKDDNFQKALGVLKSKDSGKAVKKSHVAKKKEQGSDCFKIVKMIMERNYSPCIVFSFSKKDCEHFALQLSSVDMNDDSEKELIEGVFNSGRELLSEDDRHLPQVENILPLLKRGIGIHHSGLLPIVKEIIELLFQNGLVKVLFATETFAMGLNMPAKTVVFTDSRKFDGREFRSISSGEYIQMSGRAGRRGIDDRGICIIMANSTDFNETTFRTMLGGKADALNSSFRLSYYMILNLLKVEEIAPEYIMDRSYFQHQSEKDIPRLEKRLKDIESEIAEIQIENEKEIESYFSIRSALEENREEIRKIVIKPQYSLSYLQSGRLVKVKDYKWGVVCSFSSNSRKHVKKASDFLLDIFVICDNETENLNVGMPPPAKNWDTGKPIVLTLSLNNVEIISKIRLSTGKNLRTEAAKKQLHERMKMALKQFGTPPPLDPIEHMQIPKRLLTDTISRVEALEERLHAHPLYSSPLTDEVIQKYERKNELSQEISELRKQIQDTGRMKLLIELKGMKSVLRRLHYTNQDDVIENKGRVASEISTADTLLITEMLFNGTFNKMSPEMCASLLSCTVFLNESRKEINMKLPEQCETAYNKLQETAKEVAQVSIDAKLETEIDNYCALFSPALMEVVYLWCKGAKFIEICKRTDVFEGVIVRAIRRLEELIRQICVACKYIGEEELEKKFAECITLLKRDIIFSSSLYFITDDAEEDE